MAPGAAMVCFVPYFIHFLKPLLYYHGPALWLLPLFNLFCAIFLSQLWEGIYQGNVRTNQPSAHMQQLNSGNEGQNIGGDMGVFYGGPDRSIGKNRLSWTVQNIHRGVTISQSQEQPRKFNTTLL